MCLAIPGKIKSIQDDRMYAIANFQGIKKKVIVALVPKVKVGDYVMVHAGSAISIVDQKRAQESIALWQELMEKDPTVKKEDYV